MKWLTMFGFCNYDSCFDFTDKLTCSPQDCSVTKGSLNWIQKQNPNTLQEKEQHNIAAEFKCEDCERIFKSEKNLGDHKRFHAMFEMDDSDKIYKYEGILEWNKT